MKLIKLSLIIIGCLLISACNTMRGNENNMVAQAYNPAAAKINVQLGVGYLGEGQMQRAKHKLMIGLQQDPKSSVAHNAMAYFFEMTGDLQQAEKYYKKGLYLSSGDGASQNNYGTFLCRQGKYGESLRYFTAAVKHPNYIHVPEAYENAGLCSEKIPDIKQAEYNFVLALKHDPRRTVSLIELVKIYMKQGHYRKSEGYLNKYLSISEPDAQTVWLGYRIAKILKHPKQASNYARLLRAKFSDSKEYRLYKKQRKYVL